MLHHTEDASSRKRKIKGLGNRYPGRERGEKSSQENSHPADLRGTQILGLTEKRGLGTDDSKICGTWVVPSVKVKIRL